MFFFIKKKFAQSIQQGLCVGTQKTDEITEKQESKWLGLEIPFSPIMNYLARVFDQLQEKNNWTVEQVDAGFQINR